MRWILRISSVVVLIVTALFFIEDNVTSEWRHEQNRYRERLLADANDDASHSYAKSFRVHPRQIEVRQLDRVDRCVSCHVGVENPRAVDWPQPLARHSGDILANHDVERMGCTVCHDGQGRATTIEDAHATGEGLHWNKPLLRGDLLQTTCARCHNVPPAFAAKFKAGQGLFDTLGCRGCHRVGDDGMSLGPNLTTVGDASSVLKHPTAKNHELVARFDGNVNAAYIYEAIREPAAQPSDSVMPNYDLSDDDAEALTVYLKGLTARAPALRIVPQAAGMKEPEPVLQHGQRLFLRYCRGCHGAGGRGGTPNPNAEAETIPNLDELADQLMFFGQEDAQRFIDYLIEHQAPPTDPDDLEALDLPRGRITLVRYGFVSKVIHRGNPSGMRDPEGPNPIDMPAWGTTLSDQDITAIISWLLTQYQWDEEEEE